MILYNAVKCGICGEVIFSRHRHDFVTCQCENVSVDGGLSYLRRSYNTENWTDMSIELDDKIVDKCKEALQWAEDTERNNLGKVISIIKVLNDEGVLNSGK